MRAEVIAEHKKPIFCEGLKARGYEICPGGIAKPLKSDVLVTWNRKKTNLHRIKKFEAVGARVFIAENGYIGSDDKGHKLIALALNHHLGKGRWFIGDEKRYKNHNFDILPWKSPGERIVILAQRGIGESKPASWAVEVAHRLRRYSKRPIIVRLHPGKSQTPIEPDLENVHAVVTWASGAAIKAIALGIPAFHLMPEWIGKDAAVFGVDNLEEPYYGDRENMFHNIGWAQWTTKEIAIGEAFKGFDNLK